MTNTYESIECLWLACTGSHLQLLEINTWLAHNIGHGFGYILWQFECNESVSAISPWRLLISTVIIICHFMPCTLPLYKCLWCWYKLFKMVRNSANYSYALWSEYSLYLGLACCNRVSYYVGSWYLIVRCRYIEWTREIICSYYFLLFQLVSIELSFSFIIARGAFI